MNKRVGSSLKRPWFTSVILLLVVCSFLVAIFLIYRTRRSKVVMCEEGERPTIDMNDFATQYSSFEVEFQAEIRNEAKFAGKVAPVQLQQISESLQSTNEFRKTLVAGYNACGVTRAAFEKSARRFQALDGLAHQIDGLTAKRDLAAPEQQQLRRLIDQYIAASAAISTE